MKKEFKLSERRKVFFEDLNIPEFIRLIIIGQDKEFIRRLKEDIKIIYNDCIRYGEKSKKSIIELEMRFKDIQSKIDKRAGDL